MSGLLALLLPERITVKRFSERLSCNLVYNSYQDHVSQGCLEHTVETEVRSDATQSHTYLMDLEIIRKGFSLETDSWQRIAFNWEMYLPP